MSTHRINQILSYLVDSTETLTYSNIADKISVSISTIRNDMLYVEKELNKHQLELLTIRGNGVKIVGEMERIRKFKNDLLLKNDDTYNENRICDIAYILMENKDEFTKIEKISTLLYVSPTTIRNDLTELKAYLKRSHVVLEIKQRKGIRLVGEEKELRKVFSRIFSSQTKLLDPYGFKSTYQPIQQRIIALLHVDPSVIYSRLKTLELSLNCYFSDEAFHTIVLHLAIAIRRIAIGKAIESFDEITIPIREEEYLPVLKLCSEIEEHYHVTFNETEKRLVYSLIVSSNLRFNTEVDKIIDGDHCLISMAEEIIQLVENTKQITLEKTCYMDNLVIHISPLVHRLKNNLKLTNPLIEDIKREYSDAFGIAWMTNTIFRKHLDKNLSEDEVGFIAIHIQTMIESAQEKIKTVLVCSNGVGISQLLAMRLKNHFQKLQIIDITGVEDFKMNYHRHDIDLVLSTFPLECEEPVIVVSPLLDDKDIQKINQFLFQNTDCSFEALEEVHIETIIHPQLYSFEEVISHVHEYLLKKKYVKESFRESLLKRENLCSTAIGDYTAIPHASFETVNQSTIVIVTLNENIDWKGDLVNLIMFIALTKRDSRRFSKKLRKLFYKLYQEEIHIKLINAKRKEEIISVLCHSEEI